MAISEKQQPSVPGPFQSMEELLVQGTAQFREWTDQMTTLAQGLYEGSIDLWYILSTEARLTVLLGVSLFTAACGGIAPEIKHQLPDSQITEAGQHINQIRETPSTGYPFYRTIEGYSDLDTVPKEHLTAYAMIQNRFPNLLANLHIANSKCGGEEESTLINHIIATGLKNYDTQQTGTRSVGRADSDSCSIAIVAGQEKSHDIVIVIHELLHLVTESYSNSKGNISLNYISYVLNVFGKNAEGKQTILRSEIVNEVTDATTFINEGFVNYLTSLVIRDASPENADFQNPFYTVNTKLAEVLVHNYLSENNLKIDDLLAEIDNVIENTHTGELESPFLEELTKNLVPMTHEDAPEIHEIIEALRIYLISNSEEDLDKLEELLDKYLSNIQETSEWQSSEDIFRGGGNTAMLIPTPSSTWN